MLLCPKLQNVYRMSQFQFVKSSMAQAEADLCYGLLGPWPYSLGKIISTLLNYSGRPAYYSTTSFALPLPC
jgi:hypothetical protein